MSRDVTKCHFIFNFDLHYYTQELVTNIWIYTGPSSPPADQTAWRQLLLPTAQWFPRGYILPTTAAEVSEQSSSKGSAARMMKSGHRGLQLREKQAHTPPMVLELRVRSKPGADFQLWLTLLNRNHSPRYCRREEAHRGQSASPVAELLKFFVEMVNDES